MAGRCEHVDSDTSAHKHNKEHTENFQQVRCEEAQAIWERREKARQSIAPDADRGAPPNDLVGLALSGGGIRAASVGLGALQALHDSECLDKIDYLSTVSGGGYIGGYLSSAVVSSSSSIDDALGTKKSAKSTDGTGQPPLVQRFIFGGKYLYRPWEAANKYLIGLFFNNLVLFSGLVALGALIAFVWRSLDYDIVRDYLGLFDLNSGIFTAYLPFYICMTCWIIAWLFSYLKYEAEAPGIWAQRWLYFTIASFVIGTTILLVNPETPLGDYLSIFFGESKLGSSTTLTKWLLGLLAAGLTPFLAGGRLLKIGLNPQTTWEKAIFHVAMSSLLVGVPMLVVGVVGMPNVSGTASDLNDNLRAGDIRNWPAFIGIFEATSNKLDSRDPALLAALKDPDVSKLTNLQKGIDSTIGHHLATELAINDLASAIGKLNEMKVELDEYSRWQKLQLLVGWSTITPNLLKAYLTSKHDLDQKKKVFCEEFSNGFLDSFILPFALVVEASSGPDTKSKKQEADKEKAAGLQKTGFEYIRASLKQKTEEALKNSRLDEWISDAQFSYRGDLWNENDAKAFNLALLRALHPECFYQEGKAYRHLVIVGDQKRRKWICGISLVLFLLAAGFVNLNSTSLHRFYRNRVRHAYFIPYKDDRNDFELSALGTTLKGAPYHLINAAISMDRPKFLDEVDAESADLDAERRDVQSFLFSQLYCGSQATGWARTEHYETFRTDNINFADAIALSGSVVDPLRTNSLGMSVAVSALNLGLGQWMPNPRFKKPRLKPNFFVLVKDWLRKSVNKATYCYVSDGGFADNLGIMALLRRRCRLIIAVDASRDSKRDFSDLNRVIRDARIRYGVEILEPTPEAKPCEVLNTFCLEPDDKGYSQRHFALARIRYPEEPDSEKSKVGVTEGWFVYLKPSFTGDEGADLLKYRLEAPDFPNDRTTDQFYEPARIESYRQLGFHITNDFCTQLKAHASDGPLSGMAGLHKSIVDEQLKAEAETRLKRELPSAALSLGKKIVKSLQREQITSHNSRRKTRVKPRTGTECKKSGLYEPGCGDSVELRVQSGKVFPDCPACRKPVTWTLI